MTSFQSFFNTVVIPENWKILSSRFDVSQWSTDRQRAKIIGEIVEFIEARNTWIDNATPRNYEDMAFELADVCIAIATLMQIQEKTYLPINALLTQDPERWIAKIVNRESDYVIVSIVEYAEIVSIDIESFIKRKLQINRTRKDWK